MYLTVWGECSVMSRVQVSLTGPLTGVQGGGEGGMEAWVWPDSKVPSSSKI